MCSNNTRLASLAQQSICYHGITDIESKLRVIQARLSYQQQLAEVRAHLDLMKGACEEVLTSASLQRVLKWTLEIGNAINSGTSREGAFGFRISSLSDIEVKPPVFTLSDSKLGRMKSNPGHSAKNATLLHVIANIVKKHGIAQTNALNEELSLLPRACDLELLQIDKDICDLKSLSELVSEQATKLSERQRRVAAADGGSERGSVASLTGSAAVASLDEFSEEFEYAVKEARQAYDGMMSEATDVLIQFGETGEDEMPIPTFFCRLLCFVRTLDIAFEENVRYNHLLERRQKLEDQRQERDARSPGPGGDTTAGKPEDMGVAEALLSRAKMGIFEAGSAAGADPLRVSGLSHAGSNGPNLREMIAQKTRGMRDGDGDSDSEESHDGWEAEAESDSD